ncbi:site-specific integrase [Velocimicrobium porci]|uniref:Site-specific integrase n=1 Tax=Velocimicrobium porci TaxID=2606634 RepID=A0A6L5XWQ9_9FIRM|nr:site-specific integrase [Velocimicrobium porci]MSS62788.1 site-specific integrase [Velocimicrobium porci]
MPAYKDKERNTWYCKFYYETWDGQKKHTTKRGFQTKKAAIEWENEFKASVKAEMTMTVASFVKIYFNDKKGELKERSIRNKEYMMNVHIIPYFGERKMNEITPSDIIQWQNVIREKNYSETYLRMIQNQMTALFTHAYNIYGLKSNPCKKIKKMGKSDANRLDFWTKDEYDKFIATIDHDDRYYTLFEILFWTGCRVGELLALTKSDIDFQNNQIHISKTYYRMNGEDVITTPKTEQSIRTVDIPEFLKNEIKDYVSRIYECKDNQRLFPMVLEAVQHKMKRNIEKAGVKKIRVHDLRHSHVAYLIHQGVQPLIIKERLGHRDIKITLNTYGHLYPSEQKKVAELLNCQK